MSGWSIRDVFLCYSFEKQWLMTQVVLMKLHNKECNQIIQVLFQPIAVLDLRNVEWSPSSSVKRGYMTKFLCPTNLWSEQQQKKPWKSTPQIKWEVLGLLILLSSHIYFILTLQVSKQMRTKALLQPYTIIDVVLWTDHSKKLDGSSSL